MTHPVDHMRDELAAKLEQYGYLLSSTATDQLLLQVRTEEHLHGMATTLAADNFYLVTMVANDERELEDGCFKIYYLFSHPSADLLVQAECLLPRSSNSYPSLFEWFPAVDCFEREIVDLVGLRPQGKREAQVPQGGWLHQPLGEYPLRRPQTILAPEPPPAVAAIPAAATGPAPQAQPGDDLFELLTLPIGPIHAGIIEPGQFLFTTAGEVIEDLAIRLGYTHRGLELLFQTQLPLLEGWRLAEQVSGDSSFAHSLAYCQAAEILTEVPVPRSAQLLRAVLLELERVHNHVADVAALAEDVALDRLSGRIAEIRETLLRLNQESTGHRYLRRVNRPGGLSLDKPVDVKRLAGTLQACVAAFTRYADLLRSDAGFRARTIGVGVLTEKQARQLGVTGLTARASGMPRDSRWDHPAPVYDDTRLREALAAARGPDNPEAHAGDVYARFLTRVAEVTEAQAIVEVLLDRWRALPEHDQALLREVPRVRAENNYTSAVGYVESFRGGIVYWLMQDKLNGIYRCKVRDPSLLNWPALRAAVLPAEPPDRYETVLADFPLINKSFNLSYAGNDL